MSCLTDSMLRVANKIFPDCVETSCKYLLKSKLIYIFHKRKCTIKACVNKLYR